MQATMMTLNFLPARRSENHAPAEAGGGDERIVLLGRQHGRVQYVADL